MLVAAQIINKILQTKDFGIIRRNGLDKSFFIGFEDEFTFIENHFQNYGNVPDTITFASKFSNFELFEVNETEQYLTERITEEYGFRQFQILLPKVGELAEQDSREAYSYLRQEFPKLAPPGICQGDDIISGAKERYELYKNRKNQEESPTIKTGLVELDSIFGGWEFGEELVTIVARTNMGKSWLLLKFLAEAWKQNMDVSLFSGEMSHIKLGYRFDALFGHYSNLCLVRGDQVDEYDNYIEKLTKMPTKFRIATQKHFKGKPTIPKLRNFIETTQPKILGIDQYSLMADYRGTSRDPLRITLAHIAEDLFSLSTEYSIPIIGLSQSNRAGGSKEAEDQAPGLENIKESDDIAANSSKAIGMKQSSFGLVLDVIKNREGKVGDKLLYSWDIDTGHFSYIPSNNDAVNPQLRSQVKQQTKQSFQGSINPF